MFHDFSILVYYSAKRQNRACFFVVSFVCVVFFQIFTVVVAFVLPLHEPQSLRSISHSQIQRFRHHRGEKMHYGRLAAAMMSQMIVLTLVRDAIDRVVD